MVASMKWEQIVFISFLMKKLLHALLFFFFFLNLVFLTLINIATWP